MSKKHRGKKQKTPGTWKARLREMQERAAAYRLRSRTNRPATSRDKRGV